MGVSKMAAVPKLGTCTEVAGIPGVVALGTEVAGIPGVIALGTEVAGIPGVVALGVCMVVS